MPVRILLITASLVLLAFAPAPLPRPQRQRQESTDLTGTWAFTSIEINGIRQQKDISHFRIEMTKDRITFHTERRSDWTLKLDPNASPPSFTWGVGEAVQYAGSYQLRRGGELIMIYTISSRLEDRPTNFDKAPYRYTFRRVSGG